MRKIIWGIAAVFCVQVVFQLAMTAIRSDADYAALRTPLENGLEVTSSSPPLFDADYILPGSRARTPTVAPQQGMRVLIRYVSESRRPAAAARTAGSAAFKPVVITYDRTGALTQAPKVTTDKSTAKTEQPPDSRSVLARVVTKPYDWVKAVGSHLR